MVANIHKADQSFSLAELRGRYCGAAIKPTDQTDGRRPDLDFCVWFMLVLDFWFPFAWLAFVYGEIERA